MLKPFIIDRTDAVACTKDDIDKVVSREGLAQPMRKCEISLVSRCGECLEGALMVTRMDKDIKVFGVTYNPSIALKGVGATDEEGYLRFMQRGQPLAVECVSVGIDRVFSDHGAYRLGAEGAMPIAECGAAVAVFPVAISRMRTGGRSRKVCCRSGMAT